MPSPFHPQSSPGIRFIDPLLGLSTGVLAYSLWENDARNYEQRPEGRKLADLVGRYYRGEAPSRNLLAGEKDKEGRGQDKERLV